MESKRSRRSRDTRVGDEAVATKWAPSPSWIACPACQLLYMALHEGGGGGHCHKRLASSIRARDLRIGVTSSVTTYHIHNILLFGCHTLDLTFSLHSISP
jgi:hypothetical protein